MLLVDKLNKGKQLPEKPEGSAEPAASPGLSGLVAKQGNIAARIPNVERVKKTVHERLITALGMNSDTYSPDIVQRRIVELVDEYCEESKLKLSKHDREELAELILHDVLGLGALETLLEDPEVSEIMVNGPKTIFMERRGRITQSDLEFEREVQLRRVIDRILARIGRRVDESSPMVDARLPDGSRVNAIIPPLALDGPALSIRRFGTGPLVANQLVELKSISAEMMELLAAAVRARISILISGGTGAGKTTLLNILSRYIPKHERIVTIEDAAEL